jgi:hypothetical protein
VRFHIRFETRIDIQSLAACVCGLDSPAHRVQMPPIGKYSRTVIEADTDRVRSAVRAINHVRADIGDLQLTTRVAQAQDT